MADHKKTEDAKIEEVAKEVAAANPGLDIAAAIAAGMKMAMEQVQLANASKVVPAAPKPHRSCGDCGQALTACESKHTKMVVYPTRYPEFSRFFAGVTINGKTYLSNNENHLVLVPDACVSDITKIISTFEDNEREMLIGRKGGGRRSLGSQDGVRQTQPTQAFR